MGRGLESIDSAAVPGWKKCANSPEAKKKRVEEIKEVKDERRSEADRLEKAVTCAWDGTNTPEHSTRAAMLSHKIKYYLSTTRVGR
jgi:hypothetical protein